MSTDAVTYEQAGESASDAEDYMRRFSPEHLRELAMAQAEKLAGDDEHVEKVNDLIARHRRGDGGKPVDMAALRKKLLP